MIGPVLVYVAGVVTGPLIRPVAKGTVKGTIKAGLRVKRLAGEAAAEFQGLASEASASMGSSAASPPVVEVVAAKK